MDQELTFGTFLLLTAHVSLAVLCIWSFARERNENRGDAQPWLWLVLSLPILLLGVQHATGLGSALTNALRQQALAEGWYGSRRSLQRLLVELVAPLSLVVLALLSWQLRRQWRRYLLAILAFILLTSYGAVQIISLHDVDAQMHHRWLGVNLETWLNVAGLALASGAIYQSFVERLRHRRHLATTRNKPVW